MAYRLRDPGFESQSDPCIDVTLCKFISYQMVLCYFGSSLYQSCYQSSRTYSKKIASNQNLYLPATLYESYLYVYKHQYYYWYFLIFFALTVAFLPQFGSHLCLRFYRHYHLGRHCGVSILFCIRFLNCSMSCKGWYWKWFNVRQRLVVEVVEMIQCQAKAGDGSGGNDSMSGKGWWWKWWKWFNVR